MRSFLSPESPALQPFQKEKSTSLTPKWLETLAQGLQGLSKESLFKKPEFITWGSERYFAAYGISQEAESQQLVTNQLTADLTSFFDEYAFLRASVVYKYNQHGMQNGYSEKVSEIAHNFVAKLEEQGRPAERAKLEESVAGYVEAWMGSERVQVGERLMFISPRGSQEELYPGLDERNYVFVNIYEKTESGFLFRQYRSYDPNKKLPDVLATVAASSSGQLQRITPAAVTHPDHETIVTAAHIPASQALENLERIIYTNKAKWRSDIDRDLPNLPELQAQQEQQKMLSFCLSEFSELANTDLPHEQKVAAFDLLITTAKKALLKWVENHALNYDPEKQQTFEINYDELKIAWQIGVKKAKGEKLEKEEQNVLKKATALLTLNPTLPLKSAASWAHCITGTPFSLIKLQPNLLQLSSMDLRAGGAGFALLSFEEKTEMLSDLQGYIPVDVNGERWFVPAEYLTGKGCYYDEDLGVVMGPCGLPLSEDPYALRESDYFALLSQLRMPEYSAELEKLSFTERIRVTTLYHSLQEQLFVHTASLERILFHDIFVQNSALPEELRVLRQEIGPTVNPLGALLQHLITLQLNDKTEELEALQNSIAPLQYMKQ